jgi:hypothetical protein
MRTILHTDSELIQTMILITTFQITLTVTQQLLQLNSVVLVRKRTNTTELPQPVGEVSANFSW